MHADLSSPSLLYVASTQLCRERESRNKSGTTLLSGYEILEKYTYQAFGMTLVLQLDDVPRQHWIEKNKYQEVDMRLSQD